MRASCLKTLIFAVVISACSASLEKKLIRDLLQRYEKLGTYGRPVDDVNDPMDVYFGMSIIQIMELDEKSQVLTTNVWGNYKWYDKILSWNESDYRNITAVRVPRTKIWMPDIKLYNYADTRLEELREALVVVYSDGSILYVPQSIYKSSCSIDITHFPFDVQTCIMKFGSWTYDGSKVDLHFYFSNVSGLDFTTYVKSNEWEIVSERSKKNVLYYECCKEPFIDLTFTLVLRRKVAFYNYILIMPCVLLSSLTLILFWLPPESPAKMQLGMNIFVAFFVLLLLLAESTPPAASSIPLIGSYYCLNMILITLSTFLSVIVVNIYFHGNHTHVPKLLKKIMIDVLAPALFMKARVIGMSRKNKPTSNVYAVEYGVPDTRYREEHWKLIRNGSLSCNESIRSDNNQKVLKDVEESLLQNLESNVNDIRNQLGALIEKIATKEQRESIGTEWKIVALVVDRIFFILYLICIIASGVTIFNRARESG